MPRPVVIGNKTVQLPSDWKEFTTGQLELIAHVSSKAMPVETAKLYIVLNLLGLRITRKVGDDTFRFVWRFRRGVITTEEMAQLTAAYDFLFGEVEGKPGTFVVLSGLTRDPYPHLTDGLYAFRGPGDLFEHVTYDQFVYANTYMAQLGTHPEVFPQLLACLWHRRRRFDPERIESDARRLSRLPKERQTVMFWYWIGSLGALRRIFPRVFSGSGKDIGNIFEEQQRIIDALADGDMTRKQAVRSGLLLDAMFSMDESIRKAEEMKRSLSSK